MEVRLARRGKKACASIIELYLKPCGLPGYDIYCRTIIYIILLSIVDFDNETFGFSILKNRPKLPSNTAKAIMKTLVEITPHTKTQSNLITLFRLQVLCPFAE